MPLVNCPECSREVSSAAEACPQCGHPMRAAALAPASPKCYSCAAAATTRCQSCGALSCAMHLQSIYVWHGKGSGYELRCESCHSSAAVWKVVCGVFFVIIVVLIIAWNMWANMRERPFGG